MDYVAIFGYEPTEGTKRILEAVIAYVKFMRHKYPDIPADVFWDDALSILKQRIAEG